jgi:predicted Zn-dependent peptidase
MKKVLIVALGLMMVAPSFAQVKKAPSSKPATAAPGKKIDRSKQPKPGPAPVINIKDPVIYNMPNGMTVLVVENHKVPKVRAILNIDRGPILEGDKAGVNDMMGQMLGEGTTSMPKDKFDEAVDIIGAEVNLYSGGGSASALTRYFDKAFSLMADALMHPSFPAESFDKIKSQALTGIKSTEKNSKLIADRVYNALSYGKKTAMGEFETEETIKGITLDDVKAAYKAGITPSRSYLTFVGDITPAQAKAITEKYFGKWSGVKLTLPHIPDVKNPDKTEIDFVDLPTAVQGEMRAGNLINNPMNGADYHALLLTNQILGGGAESKLFMNLREKHGFTYGSYSRMGSGRFQGTFTASAAVRTDKVDSATAELMGEILNMRDGKITDEELQNAKALYNGNFALRMEDPAITATYASNILINNLPKDFYRTYLQKINAVTKQDIMRVSKNYMTEGHSRIVIVGNGSKILPNLARLGYVIKKYDRFADPVVEETKAVDGKESELTTDKVSAFTIVDDYLKAIGGKEEAKKITSLSADITLDMMGRSFTGTEKMLAPYKHFTELKMGEMVIMKQVFNGLTGYQQQGPQKADMEVDEIKEAQDDKAIIQQVNYLSSDYKIEYKGTGKVGDEKTYRLQVVPASGKVRMEEYSTTSGLLLKTETTENQGDQEMPVTVEYKDYQKVGNILFPMEVTRNAGGQEFSIKYSNVKVNQGVTDADFN